jgi:bacteriorhodopsin
MRRPGSAVLSMTFLTVASTVVTLYWFVKVWQGDNPTDRTVLLIYAMITVFLGVVTSAMAARNKKRDTMQ